MSEICLSSQQTVRSSDTWTALSLGHTWLYKGYLGFYSL